MSANTVNRAAVMPEADGRLVVIERSIPSPGPGEVLVRNHAVAVNPFDWKRQSMNYKIPSFPVVFGSDISGIIVSVGSRVTKFKTGDRVIGYADAFVSEDNDHGAFQEYTVVPESATSKLPDTISLEEGVLLPTATASASVALFHCLKQALPKSSHVCDDPRDLGLLIWGGSSVVGAMTIQFARAIGLTVYTTASPARHDYLKSLGASKVFDYRSKTVVSDIVDAAQKAGKHIPFVLDAISEVGTFEPCSEVLERSMEGSKTLITTLPWPQDKPHPDGVEVQFLPGFILWTEEKQLSTWLFHDYLPSVLENRLIVPSPKVQVVEGGLESVQTAMDKLKAGVSCTKLVIKLLP